MSIWLFRSGSSGEYENSFLSDGKIYLTWEGLNVDLKKFKEKIDLYNYLNELYPNSSVGRNRNWTGQIWPIAHDMQIGDWVVLPSKYKSVINIGEIKGEYVYDSKTGYPYGHYRKVDWFAKDVPRVNFDQDILYSFGAFMAVCKISRNNAEERIRQMAKNGWRSTINGNIAVENDELYEQYDLEEVANDSIARFIIAKYKGHGMARLINAILKAQGYTTYISPEGPDKGVDILASPGSLGFGSPRICVQVKTQDTPLERPILDQLIGAMQNFNAEQGLLVAWGGFKNSILRETAAQFFRVRLWDQKAIINELLTNYDKLDDEIKAEIPLKRIWTITGGME